MPRCGRCAAVHINADLILLYHSIGGNINEHKTWGNKFIDNLAADIRQALPNSTGYSVRNLKYMPKFASAYPNREFVQTMSAQIPLSHNVAILDKVKVSDQRIWYIRKTAENGWSHSVLLTAHEFFCSRYLLKRSISLLRYSNGVRPVCLLNTF